MKINSKIYNISLPKTSYGVDLCINQDKIPLRIYDYVNQTKSFINNNSKKIIQKIETPQYKIQLTYRSVSGKKQNNKKVIEEYQIDVLLGVKKID